ncbi:hypothetical protein K502DRAFT_241014 [Neoconidiobolus thromboides FSU 785]|nr:hypothetical protein K502DRAFT_241014 [Neoconidiobolus thromboides FSU 785]
MVLLFQSLLFRFPSFSISFPSYPSFPFSIFCTLFQLYRCSFSISFLSFPSSLFFLSMVLKNQLFSKLIPLVYKIIIIIIIFLLQLSFFLFKLIIN